MLSERWRALGLDDLTDGPVLLERFLYIPEWGRIELENVVYHFLL